MKKTALITGASRGIGKATALRFARDGYDLALCCHTQRIALEETCRRAARNGVTVRPYEVDLRREELVRKLAVDVLHDFGHVSVLVNNAGISAYGLFQNTAGSIEDVFAVNVTGPMLLTACILPSMLEQRLGTIINVSSMWGEAGASCEVIYSSTKSAIIGFTKALAKETGPSGVRVNCVAPGVIATDMTAEFSKEELAQLEDQTPLCRIGTPTEVADVIAFLASPDASFITGAVLDVNGGFVT